MPFIEKRYPGGWLCLTLGFLACLLPMGCISAGPARVGEQPDAQAEDSVKTVILRDVHALHGGQKLYLHSDGKGFCQVITWNTNAGGFFEKRFRLALSVDAARRLMETIEKHSLFKISIKERAGLPGEARPNISVTTVSGKSATVSKWANDKNEDFDAIYEALLEQVKSAQQGKPVFEGKYEPQWMPPDFSSP